MEAIKQTMQDGLNVIPLIAILGLIILGAIAVIFFEQSIVTDQAFGVISETSKYSCVVSEIDNDLSLNCLKIK